MRSNKEFVEALKTAPASWMDTAIVVAFDNRFEFVGEDHPSPISRLNSLQEQGGVAIGLAGIKPSAHTDGFFLAEVFQEYQGQGWAHRCMDRLCGIVRSHSAQKHSRRKAKDSNRSW